MLASELYNLSKREAAVKRELELRKLMGIEDEEKFSVENDLGPDFKWLDNTIVSDYIQDHGIMTIEAEDIRANKLLIPLRASLSANSIEAEDVYLQPDDFRNHKWYAEHIMCDNYGYEVQSKIKKLHCRNDIPSLYGVSADEIFVESSKKYETVVYWYMYKNSIIHISKDILPIYIEFSIKYKVKSPRVIFELQRYGIKADKRRLNISITSNRDIVVNRSNNTTFRGLESVFKIDNEIQILKEEYKEQLVEHVKKKCGTTVLLEDRLCVGR